MQRIIENRAETTMAKTCAPFAGNTGRSCFLVSIEVFLVRGEYNSPSPLLPMFTLMSSWARTCLFLVCNFTEKRESRRCIDHRHGADSSLCVISNAGASLPHLPSPHLTSPSASLSSRLWRRERRRLAVQQKGLRLRRSRRPLSRCCSCSRVTSRISAPWTWTLTATASWEAVHIHDVVVRVCRRRRRRVLVPIPVIVLLASSSSH